MADAEVDIMFIVRNEQVLFKNKAICLYNKHKKESVILDGRIVVFKFNDVKGNTEVFVAFDDQDCYAMFTMAIGINERLSYMENAMFLKLNSETQISLGSNYNANYTFKLYKRKDMFFMINNKKDKAFLIYENKIKNKKTKTLESDFWNL